MFTGPTLTLPEGLRPSVTNTWLLLMPTKSMPGRLVPVVVMSPPVVAALPARITPAPLVVAIKFTKEPAAERPDQLEVVKGLEPDPVYSEPKAVPTVLE